MISIHTSTTPVEDAAKQLERHIKSVRNTPALILFSGGSALALVECLRPEILTKQHTLTVLDERYTFENDESNFYKLSRTSFFRGALERGVSVIDPRPTGSETLMDTARRFDLALKEWHIINRTGIGVATIGIGPDGHTAGVLPNAVSKDEFSKLFLSDNKCAVGYVTRPEVNHHRERITATLTYLTRHIDHAIIFASGTPKKAALLKTLYAEEDYHNTPAQILRHITDAQLYTDISLDD